MPIYSSFTLGTTNNQISFNDSSSSPYFRVKRRVPTRRDLREFDIVLPETSGIADYQSFLGKMYLLIEGTMYPRSTTEYDTGRKTLRKLASLDIQQADADSDDGYVPLKWSESDGYNKMLNVKVMYADIPEDSRNGLKQPFRLLCKIKHPIILGQNTISAQIGDASATTSGSSDLPWTLPIVVGVTTYSSNGTLTNAGDLGAYPTITIYGPVNRPKITNSTISKYIEVDVNLASSSDSLIITYDKDSVDITQAGNSKLANLTNGSELFKIESGTNNLTLTGSSVGSGAYATVSIYPTWPMS